MRHNPLLFCFVVQPFFNIFVRHNTKHYNMKLLGNIIWLVFGGFGIAVEYFVSSLLMMVTIIGIPFGFATLKLGVLALWPFGSHVVSKPQDSGCLSTILDCTDSSRLRPAAVHHSRGDSLGQDALPLDGLGFGSVW